ncbi:MAG: alkaline phosphatase family protein [Desulfosalsimonadaceae bacterium]
MTQKHEDTDLLDRRTFLKKMATVIGGGAALGTMGLTPCFATGFPEKSLHPSSTRSPSPDRKLIYIAIDALHPKYLELDAGGNPGGRDGNWLMPNIRKFLDRAVWYPNAKCYLPAATDMNHLNALAGTSTAQTGIIGVWAQPSGWQANGKPILTHSNLSYAKDDRGRPVDTLFHAWKRRWPNSKTFMISGKEWVAEMFRGSGSKSGVDMIVTGPSRPEYLSPPQRESFADPATDTDALCDPESTRVGFLDRNGLKSEGFFSHFSPSQTMNRLYSGQHSLLTLQMERFPSHFPHDGWVVDAALSVFKREKPDMAYILLAQTDDAGHCIGNGWDVSEFTPAQAPPPYPANCVLKPEYLLVSRRNPLIFREAALDVIRDVDVQFGRLIKGLDDQGILDKAAVILLSDHSAENHIYTRDFMSTDVMGILQKNRAATSEEVYAFSVSSYGVLYFRDKKDKVPEAVAVLKSHKALNPQTQKWECPWWVLDRLDMKNGVNGVALPGELYHAFHVDKDREKSMIWPDVIILAKNGWQIPVYNGHIPNVGINVPTWTPPFRVYNGGHGSVDTLPIVAAVSLPEGRSGVNDRPVRIGDLGVTAASVFGLNLQSTTIGQDLSGDL